MSVGALAAGTKNFDNTNQGTEQNNETDITVNVPSGWQITIPDDITLNATTESKDNTVALTSAIINDGQTLTVKVSSQNEWTLIHNSNSNAKIQYSVKDAAGGSGINNGNRFTASSVNLITYEAGTEELPTIKLNIAAESTSYSNAKISGDYQDTLTFTVDCE